MLVMFNPSMKGGEILKDAGQEISQAISDINSALGSSSQSFYMNYLKRSVKHLAEAVAILNENQLNHKRRSHRYGGAFPASSKLAQSVVP